MSNAVKGDIDHLNSFLRGERSAVETYDQVIEKAESPEVAAALREGRDSHTKRVRLLAEKVRELGGTPSDDSGAWGSLVKALQGGAKVFGLGAAVSVLQEGEEHGLEDYRGDLGELSAEIRQFVATSLLPEQGATHELISKLEQRV